MNDRDLFDLLLVLAAGILAYTETFGWADPLANFDRILALFGEIDTAVYLVLGGLLGILFVGYLVAYLPRKQAGQSIRDR